MIRVGGIPLAVAALQVVDEPGEDGVARRPLGRLVVEHCPDWRALLVAAAVVYPGEDALIALA